MINIIYYFKKNHQVYKSPVIPYYKMLELLEMTNEIDNKGQSYSNGHTYQLQWMQNFLLNNKDLQICRCNIYIDDQKIF